MTTKNKVAKKKPSQSPTQLSLKRLRTLGMTAQVVEHWNPFAKVRQDLFGFIDIVAMGDNPEILIGLQTTSRGNMSARIQKIMALDAAKLWSLHARIIVDGWDKHSGRWRCKSVRLRFNHHMDVWEEYEWDFKTHIVEWEVQQ